MSLSRLVAFTLLALSVLTNGASVQAQSVKTYLRCEYQYSNGTSRSNIFSIDEGEFRYLIRNSGEDFTWSENLSGVCVTLGAARINIDVSRCRHSNWGDFVEMTGVSISRLDGEISGEGVTLTLGSPRSVSGACQRIENPLANRAF